MTNEEKILSWRKRAEDKGLTQSGIHRILNAENVARGKKPYSFVTINRWFNYEEYGHMPHAKVIDRIEQLLNE